MTPQTIMTTGNRRARRNCFGSNSRYARHNRSLVNRIEGLINPSFLKNSKVLLEENNSEKKGNPFRTPDAFITFHGKLRAVYHAPFRTLEGFAEVILPNHRHLLCVLHKHIHEDHETVPILHSMILGESSWTVRSTPHASSSPSEITIWG